MKRFLFLFFSIYSIVCWGQSYKLFTTDRHLSSSLINSIYEDSKGMIWIATEDGLNRYDGSKFTIYKNNPEDGHSLAHNYVCTLFEDSQGHLFVGSYGGVQLYDRAADNFSPKAASRNGEAYYNNVQTILERHNGDIWVSGDYLSSVTIEDGKLVAENLNINIPVETNDCMIEDNEYNIWISRGEEGIYQIKPDGSIKHYPNHEIGASIISLCKDAQGRIYAGSMKKGLYTFDKEQEKFVNISGEQNLPVKSLFPTGSEEIYMSTDGKGVKIYNTRRKDITDYTFDNSNFDSNKLKVHFTLKDKAGNLWFAIYQKGVAMIPKQSNGFSYIGYKSVKNNIIGSCCITSLHRGKNGILWVGTDNDGIYGLLPGCNQPIHYAPSDKKESVPAIILTVHEDSEGSLWYGSFTDGMGRIDFKNGFHIHREKLSDRQDREVQRVYDFVEDNDKRLWIATLGSGLFYHDLKKRQTVYDASINKGLNQWISCLYHSSDNHLYIGTYRGLYVLDLNDNSPVQEVLSRRIILNICEDSQGQIWAGGSDGLSVWNPATKQTHTYSTHDGLPSNTVYAIQDDNHGNLWISTNSGLSKFSIANGKFTNYYVGNGLQGNEFSKNSTHKDAEGTLWFGGINGITTFNPQDISLVSKQWSIRITDFYLHNLPVRKGTLSGGQPVISEPVYEAKEFHLAYEDNTFSIEFSPLEYNVPERINYLYSINDKEWINLPEGTNRIPFYNLAPGTYRFKVKAEDNGVYSIPEEIIIHISPAWWASIGAKLCYLLIVAGIIFLIVKQTRNRYREKQQMMQHIHAEEIKEAKLQFFINISHEIRTPISFIINPLQKLMEMDDDKERNKIYHTIYRNSERILRLINQLMDLRKIDKGKMRLSFQETEIVGFISDICETFSEQAGNKRISLHFHHEELSRLCLWTDPYHFDKIILNLLSNALKFTPEGGEISVSLREVTDLSLSGALQHHAELIVSDTGTGIAEEEIKHIFNRFYQVPNTSGSKAGTGIGLHLTQSLVELHYGDITCRNNEDGPGCRFIVRIPLGNKHLPEEDLCQDKAVTRPTLQETYFDTFPSEEEQPADEKNKNLKYHILIAEDNEEIRRYITLELSSKYHVKSCSNGKEALDEIFRKAPDLVISDIMMPEMDGLTLCRKLKSNINLNHIPIILLTAKVQEEDKMEALDRGADAYITKPFNNKILEKTINNLILSREKLKNTFSGHQEHNDKLEKIEVESPDDRLMGRIMKVINSHLSDPGLTVEMIANEVGTSRVHLNRKLKELTNQTAREFIKNCRLKQAALLLSEKKQNITEIAELTGFTNPNNFSTAFKELFGVSPSAYKEHLETKQEEDEK